MHTGSYLQNGTHQAESKTWDKGGKQMQSRGDIHVAEGSVG